MSNCPDVSLLDAINVNCIAYTILTIDAYTHRMSITCTTGTGKYAILYYRFVVLVLFLVLWFRFVLFGFRFGLFCFGFCSSFSFFLSFFLSTGIASSRFFLFLLLIVMIDVIGVS